MAKRDVAFINGGVAKWARDRAGLEPEAVAKKMGKGFTAQQVLSWEAGGTKPTFAQAEKLANILRLPFGILFMPAPPDIRVPLPDLRTLSGESPAKPSLDFLDVVNDCVIRQHWYQENQRALDAKPLPFVSRFATDADPVTVANDIAQTLEVDDQLRRSCSRWSDFYVALTDKAEKAGILVMRSSVVRHASRRGLSVDEFRGFAIADDLAPLIFVNSKDATSAQIFTLAHELVHIWIGASGISNPNPKRREADLPNPIERYCNRVAAEFLVPRANVEGLWRPGDSADANVQRLAAFHKVSKTAAAIRARELGKISYETAAEIISAEERRLAELKARAAEKEGGPTFWASFGPRSSPRLIVAIVTALDAGTLLYREAANLLGVKQKALHEYQAKLGVGR